MEGSETFDVPVTTSWVCLRDGEHPSYEAAFIYRDETTGLVTCPIHGAFYEWAGNLYEIE